MFCRTFAASITLALATSGVALAAPGHEHVVAAIPQTGTPAVDDGAVFAITQAGSTMVIGGRFTSVDSPPRSRLAAFDRATGALRGISRPATAPAVGRAGGRAVAAGHRGLQSHERHHATGGDPGVHHAGTFRLRCLRPAQR